MDKLQKQFYSQLRQYYSSRKNQEEITMACAKKCLRGFYEDDLEGSEKKCLQGCYHK